MKNPLREMVASGLTGCAAPASSNLRAMTLLAVQADGTLLASQGHEPPVACLWLEGGWDCSDGLRVGDRLLVAMVDPALPPVAMGRIGRYVRPEQLPHVAIRATESISLQCGEASIDLRADGKVMVRGEDVLLRAKGTQRIRAGNVAIN